MLGWHFLQEDRKLRWGTKEKMRKGSVCKVKGPLTMCKWGLHASAKPLDALKYAPGPIVCRVELSGEIIKQEDKACATERKVLEIADASTVLHEFACWCAERALKRANISDKHCWNAIKVKRAWLEGKATDKELHVARDAAWAAAWAAARAAAWNAAWNAAWDAARDAERKAQNRKLTQMLNKLLKEKRK